MILNRLFGRSNTEDPASMLYAAIVAQARQPEFYRDLDVPDTLDGRFDLLILHAYLAFDRLKSEGGEARDFSQRVFDVMFADLDQNLRELGISDVSIGKKVEAMVSAFYGRTSAYDSALNKVEDKDEALIGALERNIYPDGPPAAAALELLAAYVRNCRAHLAARPPGGFLGGHIDFPPPPDTGLDGSDER